MLSDPQRCIEIAWATNRDEDFIDESYGWLFGELVKFWEESEGKPKPGPHFFELIAAQYQQRYELPATVPEPWLEELLSHGSASAYEPSFRWHCERLAAGAAVRRVRALLYRWYSFLTRLAWHGPEGEEIGVSMLFAFDGDPGGGAALEQIANTLYEGGYRLGGGQIEPASAPQMFAVIAHEILDAIRRMPDTPQRAMSDGFEWSLTG